MAANGATYDYIIKALYKRLLDRDPDSTGYDSFKGQFSQNDWRGSIDRIADQIIDSNEFISQMIDYPHTYSNPSDMTQNLYERLLWRNPDAGAQGWTNGFKKGLSYTIMSIGVAKSDEFQSQLAHNTTPEKKLDFLYARFLERKPDDSGRGTFLPQLAAGNSDAVIEGILRSAEFDSMNPKYTGPINPPTPNAPKKASDFNIKKTMDTVNQGISVGKKAMEIFDWIGSLF